LTVLGLAEVNRATLDRQFLLHRAALRPTEVIGHLGGLQAQAPFPPYFDLWTRLAAFRPEDLAGRLLDRSASWPGC
jgi:hypothetical protein